MAWFLGGFLEEFLARGVVLNSVVSLLSGTIGQPLTAVIAIFVAGIGAGLMHFYQGAKSVVIVGQLSIIFGILFVVSGYNLWAVILCHGLYDTVAFIRFATRKSKYSKNDDR